jgi:hypothetical protein
VNKIENEDKIVVPSEKHYADFEPSAPPVAPDGGIAPGFALEQPTAPPAVSAENFICVRGPCRHYWHLVTTSGAGNPKGTWDALGRAEPRQHSHTCIANAGMETDLTDDAVFECSKWDPITPEEQGLVQLRRQTYYATHPEFAPDVAAVELTETVDEEEEGDGTALTPTSSEATQG